MSPLQILLTQPIRTKQCVKSTDLEFTSWSNNRITRISDNLDQVHCVHAMHALYWFIVFGPPLFHEYTIQTHKKSDHFWKSRLFLGILQVRVWLHNLIEQFHYTVFPSLRSFVCVNIPQNAFKPWQSGVQSRFYVDVANVAM